MRAALALLLAGAFALAGCGGGHGHDAGHQAPSVAASAAFNATDVQFATDMIPHHRQAVEMAALAPSKAAAAEVKALAEKIRKAQEPEIAIMSGWLTAWGEPVPSAGAMHHDSGDMGGMPGMLTDTELRQLGAATGAAFDRLFLTLMIKHHEGAVETATTVQAKGEDPAVQRVAADIVKSQTAEITEMKALLDKTP
jgi:uncharacterized protein (DUF305 family)